MAINNTLKDIREERNLIQADLAEAIGSCSQTIGDVYKRQPEMAQYQQIPGLFSGAGYSGYAVSASPVRHLPDPRCV